MILAGITINALTGSDSAPAKANEAAQKNDIGTAKDEISLLAVNAKTKAYDEAYVGNGISAGEASASVGRAVIKTVAEQIQTKNQYGKATIEITGYGDLDNITNDATITIKTRDSEVTGKITLQDGVLTWGEIEEPTLELKDQPIDTILSRTSKIKLKDNKGNKIAIPANFKLSSENAVKPAGNNVEEGIIIEDEYGNQFVWVPVGTITKSNGDTVNIPLTRVDTSSYYQEYENGQGTEYPNTKTKSISAFKTSVSTNKGFYIARYEAGVDGTSASNSSEFTGATYSIPYGSATATTFNKNGTENSTTHLYELSDSDASYLVSKSGAGVWNDINQLNAAKMCRNMYGENAGVISDLMNSYAWDTAITFIQTCGTETNSQSYTSQSGESGTSPSALQTTGTNTLSSTSAVDKQCNIFDLAGNVMEWTTEITRINGNPVFRGGYWCYNGTSSSRGNIFDCSGHIIPIGFRPILYL